MIACLFDPLGCFSAGAASLADSILSLFPFGLYGLVFLAGMIVGERIGLWGILVAVLGWIAIRFGRSRPDDFTGEHGDDPAYPAPPRTVRLPIPKKRKLKGIFTSNRKENP